MPLPFLQAVSHVVALTAFVLLLALSASAKPSVCPTGFANFGDSLTDTGGVLDVFPLALDPENPPYGETFFGKPAKRFSNGRVVPDFFSLAFKKALLDSYFSVTTFEYSYGINFAQGGATAAPTLNALNPISLVPFQLGQFIKFVKGLASTQAQPSCVNFLPSLPEDASYKGWLYTIEIGGNDLLSGLRRNASTSEFLNIIIPGAVEAIVTTVNGLYETGARRFLIFGIPVLGCSGIAITTSGSAAATDSLGCIPGINQLAKTFNTQLLSAIQVLRKNHSHASIAYFDYYGANLEILENASKYGFNPKVITRTCCGAGGVGKLNYNPNVTCGRPGSNSCANPEEYIIWDGVHFTEAYYRLISKFALTNKFTSGGVNYAKSCKLDFSKFGPSVRYEEVYPTACTTVFV